MVRTIIPTKIMDEIESYPFTAKLKRWEHVQGCLPIYVIELYEDWTFMERHELKPTADNDYEVDWRGRWEEAKEQLAIMVAKRAFGLVTQPHTQTGDQDGGRQSRT